MTEVAASDNRLYVNATDGRITVIDTTNDVNSVIRADGLGTFQDLKVSPDGTRLYGTTVNGGLTVINTSTMTATAIPIGPTWNSQLLRNEYVNSVGNVAVRPDGKRAYVTFGATIAERGVGGQSNGSFFTDAQGVSWMVTGGYSGVSVIDTDPTSSNFNKEIARIIVPLGVHDVAASGKQPLCHEWRWQDCHRHQYSDQYARRDVHHRPDSFRWPSHRDHGLPVRRGVPGVCDTSRQHYRLHPVRHGGSERHVVCHGLHRR